MDNTPLDQAILQHQQGHLNEAIAGYRDILQSVPTSMEANRLLSLAYHQMGETEKAIETARYCVALQPKNGQLAINLASFLQAQNNVDEALQTLQTVQKLDRRNVDVELMMGDLYQEKQNFETAIVHYHKALKLNRSIPEIYNNLGNALLASNLRQNLDQAIQHYQKAILLNTSYQEAYYNLGSAYLKQQLADKALEQFRMAVQYRPGCYKSFFGMGKALTLSEKHSQASELYQAALKLIPQPATPQQTEDQGNILFALGNSCYEQKQYDQAIRFYDSALQLKPLDSSILGHLANAFSETGLPELARSTYHTMASEHPEDAFLHYFQSSFCFPVVYPSHAELLQWRERYDAELSLMLEQAILTEEPPGKALIPSTNHFYVAYQGLQDKTINQKLSSVYQAIFAPERTPVAALPVKSPSEKITIGFVSRFFIENHTIQKLAQGLIKALPRERFNIIVFSAGAGLNLSPGTTSLCTHPEDRCYALSYHNGQAAIQLIQHHQPDILFYTDLGMEPFTYWLAHHRLAPVQCVTWGHPVTSGIANMDYFISSKLIEPENPQAHYSEKLVLLNHLPTVYPRPEGFDPVPDEQKPSFRHFFGLPQNRTLYLCPQSLFKFHPDFDVLLQGILEKDTQGILVLISHPAPAVNQQLLKRFSTRFTADCLQRVVFLPRLDQQQFKQLLSCADVMLDPPCFGGGNTNYEALAIGLPVVTLPGESMRSRIALGCYQQMNFLDCVAGSPANYIELAFHLGTNVTHRQQISKTLLQQQAQLFGNTTVIQELEAFLLTTVRQQRFQQNEELCNNALNSPLKELANDNQT
jgi:protein O-GlcNAc transferase